ncbi:uncharacterized protein LOC141534655 [Cotesia typhae]|uniref:uncharacterized protein LOC141534655 n=1 Tax=Cotesia typhae TaxID=2053667 RepID=UPI003D68D2BC
MGNKKRKHQKENKDDVERSIKRMKKKLREQEEKIERLKRKHRRYSSTSSSSSDNEEDLRGRPGRGRSPLFPVDQILKELNNIDPQTNQLKNKSVPATSVQSKGPGVTTAPVTTVAADPQDGTTPGVSVSNKAVSKDSAQGLEASSTTKATTEASASQESAPKTSEEVKLDEKMLEALGKRLDPEKKTAPAVHKDLFLRWKEILKNGLPKEEREKILAKYPTPENCLTLEPQKMNAEIKASLLEPLIKKDNRLVEK